MFRQTRVLALGGWFLVGVLAIGCERAEKAKPADAPKPATGMSADKPAAEDASGEAAQIAKAMAQLSPEDRALATKQKVCLVSDELLGTMGKPYKMEVKGQAVFLCCKGCEDDLKSDPDKYLAKLKQLTGK